MFFENNLFPIVDSCIMTVDNTTVEGTECTIRFYFLGRKSVRKGFNTLFMNLIRKK